MFVPTLLAIGANLCFVLSNVIFRRVETDASPKFINMFRTGIGSIFFVSYCAIFQLFPVLFAIPAKFWGLFIISLFFGQVIGDTAYFTAQKTIGASKALAIAITFPIFTFLISVIFLGRTFDFKFFVGGIIILIGIVFLQQSRRKSASSSTNEGVTAEVLQKPSFWAQNKSLLNALLASLGWAIGISLLDYTMNTLTSEMDVGIHTSMLINVIRFPPIFVVLSGLVYVEARQNPIPRSKKTYSILLLGALIGSTVGVFFFNEDNYL